MIAFKNFIKIKVKFVVIFDVWMVRNLLIKFLKFVID